MAKPHDFTARISWTGNRGEGTRTYRSYDRTWNIETWPAIFVLDHKGVIRYKDIKGSELHRAVEKLVSEAEK